MSLSGRMARRVKAMGVRTVNEYAVLYKAVNDHYRSVRGTYYTPGTTAEAGGWRRHGLYFSPTPAPADYVEHEFELDR